MEIDRDEQAEHRQTAADWHGGQNSPLYAYASTGTVTEGLLGEIDDCLALVERGAVNSDTDVVDEHARLRTLLDAVRPEVARLKAHTVGYEHGENAAAWWQQDTIGGRVTRDTTAVARQVLQGIEDGDPAILDALPSLASAGWPDNHTPADLADDCLWPEPDLDDADAHQRWLEAQPSLRDAYEDGFDEGVHDAVAQACRDELDEAPEPQPRSIDAVLSQLDDAATASRLRQQTEGLGL